jgi:arginyl-tRNA synthetase
MSRPPQDHVDTAVPTRGPAEEELDRIVGAALMRHDPLPPAGHVEWVRRRELGDFRIDVRPLLGVQWPGAPEARLVMDALRRRPEIEEVSFAPPRVLFRVSLPYLHALVLGAADRNQLATERASHGSSRHASVTFSDPNINKPLHVGHVRSNAMGIAVARMLEHDGWSVQRFELCSDWGLHICQAVLGYQRWGDGATPESSGLPGDVLVGRSYVRFHREAAAEGRLPGFRPGSSLEDEASRVLMQLEQGDAPELLALQSRITGWVEDGMTEVYERLGSGFDARFRESRNRHVGRALVERGLATGVCRRRDDGSVYIDLRDAGHEEFGQLTLVRPDGTDLVYTRAFGAVVERQRTRRDARVIDVLGSDWRLAYPAFLEALAQLGETWARQIELVFHGMVRTDTGPMSSRAGEIVPARDVLDAATKAMATRASRARWGGDPHHADPLGVGLVKHHLLSTPRRRDLVFDEHHMCSLGAARFAALLDVLTAAGHAGDRNDPPPRPRPSADGEAARTWRELIHALNAFPRTVALARRDLEPSRIVRYLDDLATAVTEARRSHELGTAWETVSAVMARGLWLLGIDLPSPLGEGRERAGALAGTTGR